jgi:hypothetical protein
MLDEIDWAGARPVLIAPGEAIAFSSQHAHAGVQNHTDLTRISFETRTLLVADHLAGRGAPNVDGRAIWTTPGMFRRIGDGRRLSEVLGTAAFEPFTAPAGLAGGG